MQSNQYTNKKFHRDSQTQKNPPTGVGNLSGDCVVQDARTCIESTPLVTQEVEHFADAIGDDGAAHCLYKPIYKLHASHLLSVSRKRIHGGDNDILQQAQELIKGLQKDFQLI